MKYRETLDTLEGFLDQGKEAMMEKIRSMPEEREGDDEFLITGLKEGLEWIEEFDRAKELLKWFYFQGEERLSELGVTEYVQASRRDRSGRVLNVEITQGMINQSLLTLTESRKRGLIELGEKMEIELPDGTMFSTTFTSPGNRLTERSQIKYFYQKWGIKPEDMVSLKETSRGHWKLEKFDPMELVRELL